MSSEPRPSLSPEDENAIREKARHLVGLGVVRQIQVIARKYQEEQAFKRRAAAVVAAVCAVFLAAGAVLLFTAPWVLEELARIFS